MKLFIGLGNPGEKYVGTRHNAGHMFIDKVKDLGLTIKGAIFVKTNTFMNDSGTSVKEILDKNIIDLSNLYIIHDDLDLPLGMWKLSWAKGPKDNGGINSIEQVLATENFWRIRVGIDNRNPESKTPGEKYVLEEFGQEERETIDKVLTEICKKLETL